MKKLLCDWASIGPRPRCYRATAWKLSRLSRPGGPDPLWAPGYQLGHGRACEHTPRWLPSGRWPKSGEPEVLGSGGSVPGGHRCQGGPIGGNEEEWLTEAAALQWWVVDRRRLTDEGLEERWRLELELLACSMGTRQSSWHGRLGRGTSGGVGSMVRCSHGWGGRCWLCFSDSLRWRFGGRQLNARALLREVRPEMHGRLLRWLAWWSLTSRMSSNRAATQGRRAERDGSGEWVAKLVSPRCKGRDKGGRWRHKWDCWPVGTVGNQSRNGLAATVGTRVRKTSWWLTCGPLTPFNLIHFSKAPTSKFTNMIFPMSKNGEPFWGDQWGNKEQLSFLAPLPNHSRFVIRKPRNNSNLNLAWILKGFKPFWKNLINPLKFYVPNLVQIVPNWAINIALSSGWHAYTISQNRRRYAISKSANR
jgi:hypothetical protein